MTTPAYLTALVDQLDAASRDAHRTLRAAARHRGVRLTNQRPAPWLASHAAALGLALRSGTARLCPHLGPAPQVVYAAVWAPGLLACPACTHLLTPTPAEDATCDRCRRHARRLHAAAVAFGPILLGYGLCRACHTETRPTRKDTPR